MNEDLSAIENRRFAFLKDDAQSIAKSAVKIGFADVSVLQNNGCARFLLFTPYLPAYSAEAGKINLSNYYIVSQSAYRKMQAWTALLRANGVKAGEARDADYKGTATRAGGFIGRNTLYYHPRFGSFTRICIVDTDIKYEDSPQPPPAEADACADCGECMRACPAGAITQEGFAVEKCVRSHMNDRIIPEAYRPFIYQLFGCERCQTACPKNSAATLPPRSFDIREVLRGEKTKEIAELAGKNIGRRRIILNQTLICAANAGAADSLAEVRALTEDPYCKESALWAEQKLKGLTNRA